MRITCQGRLVHRHGPTPLPMLPHLHTGDARRAHRQNSTVSPHNGSMTAMYSAEAAKDAARRLADALAKPASAAPFTRFVAQTMDTTRQLADSFATTGAPTPTPTLPPRRTCATIQLPLMQSDTDHQAPPRVPPTVLPCRTPIPPPVPPPRVEP